MKLMLDTNICIAMIKQKPNDIGQKFSHYQIGDICISSVSLAELSYGVAKSQFSKKNKAALEEFVMPLKVAEFDESAAQYYGVLRATLEKKGIPIGPLDTMIAAHALSLHVSLVTNNTREFSRVEGLNLLDWISN